ncbi:MAG: outer membrane protein assembly factor BamE [Betaproteobacteria bacterium]|nr:outer membrane protein assembly factor BamE [Betaproteobacteria bacterium]
MFREIAVKSAPALRACALLSFFAPLLSACSYLPSIPSIGAIKTYRIEIQQGNFLSQEMVSQLKPGMTREQVRFVLGTPLVTDIFHANRWDYVFYREAAGGTVEHRQLSVFFEDDRLARVTGDVKPAGGDKPAADAPKSAAELPGAGKTEAKN